MGLGLSRACKGLGFSRAYFRCQGFLKRPDSPEPAAMKLQPSSIEPLTPKQA